MRETVELNRACRGVAQPGSVLAWGASGRPFKSARPDQNYRVSVLRTETNRIVGYSILNTQH